MVQVLVDKGFVGGEEKWDNVILVGTKNDRADDEERQCFIEEVVPTFFSRSAQSTGRHVLSSKDDFSRLVAAIAALPNSVVQYRQPNAKDMGEALADKMGIDKNVFEAELIAARDSIIATLEERNEEMRTQMEAMRREQQQREQQWRREQQEREQQQQQCRDEALLRTFVSELREEQAARSTMHSRSGSSGAALFMLVGEPIMRADNMCELIGITLRVVAKAGAFAWVIPGILFIIGLCTNSDFYDSNIEVFCNGKFIDLDPQPCQPLWFFIYIVQMCFVGFTVVIAFLCRGCMLATE